MENKREKMIEMRESGMTYAEIGKKFNLSKQRIYQLIGGHVRAKTCFKPFSSQGCIYEGLRDYLNENKISANELTRRIYGGSALPVNSNRIKALLRGIRTMTLREVKHLLDATGLTFEQAFESRR